MNSQITLEPVGGERMLEHLEAEFLRSPPGCWPTGLDIGVGTAEMPAPTTGWPVDDREQCRITQYRTRSGCCGG